MMVVMHFILAWFRLIHHHLKFDTNDDLVNLGYTQSQVARNRVDALDILANTSVENIFLLVLHKSWLTKNNSFYIDL